MPPDSSSRDRQPNLPRGLRLGSGRLSRGRFREHLHRHRLTLTVLLSLLLHGAGLFVLDVGLRPSPGRLAAAQPPARDPLRFEFVETPESAAVEEARDVDSSLASDRNTRSQEPDPNPDRAVTGSPRISQDGESHDLRPMGTAPQRGMPSPPTSPPSQANRPSRPSPSSVPEEAQRPVERERPRRGIDIQPEPVPDAPPPEQANPERRPPTAPGPENRPSPSAPPAEEAVPPTAFQLGDTFRPGRPSPTQAEQDLLARAEAEGEFSFEATEHFFAEYFLRMRREIETTWTLLLMSRFQGEEPSRAVLEFLVRADGSIAGPATLTAEGDELFPLVCSAAIRNAAPSFGPVPYDAVPQLPESAKGLPLRVRVSFKYQ